MLLRRRPGPGGDALSALLVATMRGLRAAAAAVGCGRWSRTSVVSRHGARRRGVGSPSCRGVLCYSMSRATGVRRDLKRPDRGRQTRHDEARDSQRGLDSGCTNTGSPRLRSESVR